jgi:hypothetical protein
MAVGPGPPAGTCTVERRNYRLTKKQAMLLDTALAQG